MAAEAEDGPSRYFAEERTEAVTVQLSKATKEALDRWARLARLSPESLAGALVSEWAHHAGGVWAGVWSKGQRVVIDWPLNGHFVILRVPKGAK